jgi:hypothetical protein
MAYRCVTFSVAGFVQQLAVCYVSNGYWFYVSGRVPDHKDPAALDQKIITQYGLDISKWERARRKQAGLANAQYLRYGRFFVILATHGPHAFFTGEAGQIWDIRRHPLYFMGYSIGYRQARNGQSWHVSVRIQRELCSDLKARFETLALQLPVEELIRELREIDYEPFAPVRAQLRAIMRAVNRKRELAGLELVPRQSVYWRRFPVRPFEN